MAAGVPELNEIGTSIGTARAAGPDFPPRLAQWNNETVLVQRRIFQRRHPRFIDAYGGRDNSSDAAMGKSLLEMNPGRRNRAVIIGRSSAHRRPQHAICKCNIIDSKRL